MIGTTVHNYQILEKIGHGGMGVVYKGFDMVLQRTVALKFLPEDLATDQADKARFLREARAASAINHPNVCTIYDLKEDKGEQFIVMEYIEGETLKQLTVDHTQLSIEKIIDYAVQISEALVAAHARGILHRDIKSENIMVTSSGQIKVMDFGLALVKGSQRLTRSSSTVGTIAYMSPEQIEGRQVDARSDIFSFGVVLYELLTSRLPFIGENQAAVIHAILNHPPTPMDGYRQLAPEIVDLVYRALEKRAEDRFQTFQEIRDILLRIKEGRAEAPKRRRKAAALPRERASKHRRNMIGVAMLTMICITAVLCFQWFKTDTKPQMNIVQLTASVGACEGVTFSPDGKQIAFHWSGENGGTNDIYIQQISTGQVLQLTKNPANDIWPAWSPDGQYIAFGRMAETEDESGIFLISSLGGAERKIYNKLGWNPSWSPDGRYLCFFGFLPSGIYVLELATGKVTQISFAPIPYIYSLATVDSEFSPDGKMIAFIQYLTFGISEVYLIPFLGGKPQQLTFDGKEVLGLTWSRDGRRLIFSSNRSVSQKLWSMRRDGSGLKMLEIGGQNSVLPALSADGRRLAYNERRGGTFDIGYVQVTDSNKPQVPIKFLSSLKDELFLNISADGRQFVYYSNKLGYGEVWKCNPDGSNQLPVTSLKNHSGTPQLSPDGSMIAFDSRLSGNSDIFIIPIDGGAYTCVAADANDELLPSWSADGTHLYYCLNRDEDFQIWKIPVNGGAPTRITKNGGYNAFEAPDGLSVYYTKRFSPILYQCDLDGENERTVLEFSTDFRSWSVAPEGIYFMKWNEAEQCTKICVYEFASRQIKILAVLSDLPACFNPVIAPDRKRIFLSYMELLPQSDIILVDNFE